MGLGPGDPVSRLVIGIAGVITWLLGVISILARPSMCCTWDSLELGYTWAIYNFSPHLGDLEGT